MKAEVYPSELQGEVLAPGSKSIAQRLVACALLAKGVSVLSHFPDSDDCQSAVQMAIHLGALVERKGNNIHIQGGYPNNFASGIRNAKGALDSGESGLGARMFSAIAALSNHQIKMTGHGTLLQRPFHALEDALQQLGATCVSTDGCLPLSIQGPIRGGAVKVDGSVSSQFLTGLLLALPKASMPSKVEVINAKSLPYIDMTIAVAKMFGVDIQHQDYMHFDVANKQAYQPMQTIVPGDWSGAAFLLVAGALTAKDGIIIGHLDQNIPQADSAILDGLRLAGVKVVSKKQGYFVKRTEIQAFDFNAEHCPDLFPPLVALAAFANGVSTIYGANRLINKESNRAKSLQDECGKVGVRIVVRDNEMKIYPGAIRSGIVQSHNDHRIAMAMSVIALAGDKLVIKGAECINKSYPDFFRDLQQLGAQIRMSK
jgi:3-phosphoshikimate 1-carboxyvinyltransferase